MKDLVKDLVKINSVSRGEEKIANFIFNWLKNHGISVQKQDRNIVCCLVGKNSSKALVFNGHMDTVGFGKKSDWEYGPFNGTVKNGKLCGLGASDMKGGLAVMMQLADWVKNSGFNPNFDIWFSFVVKEELDGSGTKSFLDWFVDQGYLDQYQKISAIIGEPTDLKKIEVGHRGNAFVRVKAVGQSGHGSRPEKVRKHAILQIVKLINALPDQIRKWQEEFVDDYLGMPTIALTGISSDSLDSPNKFASQCWAQFDIRTTPELHSQLKKCLNNWTNSFGLDFEFIADPCSFGWCDPGEKIVEIIRGLVPGVKVGQSKGASDQCFFTELKIPTVLFGPGNSKMAHKINEWIEVDRLSQCFDIYKSIIKKF